MKTIRTGRMQKVPRVSLTVTLIAINVLVWFVLTLLILVFSMSADEGLIEKTLSFVAVNPQLFVQGYFWTILTSVFTHISFTHLLVNMISLFFIGSFVERLIGQKRYGWFYLISGLAGSLLFVLLAYFGQSFSFGQNVFGGIDASAVGASGAIFGLGGLLAVILPKLRVLVFFVIPMPMWLAMTVLMFGLWILSAAGGLPIGNTAHFGGLIVGLAYGFYLRTKYSRKVALLNRMFIGR